MLTEEYVDPKYDISYIKSFLPLMKQYLEPETQLFKFKDSGSIEYCYEWTDSESASVCVTLYLAGDWNDDPYFDFNLEVGNGDVQSPMSCIAHALYATLDVLYRHKLEHPEHRIVGANMEGLPDDLNDPFWKEFIAWRNATRPETKLEPYVDLTEGFYTLTDALEQHCTPLYMNFLSHGRTTSKLFCKRFATRQEAQQYANAYSEEHWKVSKIG